MRSATTAALLLLVIAISISNSSGLRLRLWRILAKPTDNLCASQRTASWQTLHQCTRLCRETNNRIKRFSCRRDCWFRFLLGTEARADAYDKQVKETGCDNNFGWRNFQCRRMALKTVASAPPVLSQLQQYNILVCQHRCPTSLLKAVCSANCQLSQLVSADAYKKFAECFASQDCASKPEGAQLDKCRQGCLSQC